MKHFHRESLMHRRNYYASLAKTTESQLADPFYRYIDTRIMLIVRLAEYRLKIVGVDLELSNAK